MNERLVHAIASVQKNPRLLYKYIKRYINIIKLYVACALVFPFRHRLSKRNIWLIGEKGTEARDNGYFFYKYIRENHPEINAYFCITKNSKDRKKVSIYKTIVDQNSFRHYVYCLIAKVSANSQPFGAIPDPSGTMFPVVKRLRRKDQIVVYLKHGIVKDELPHVLDYKNTRFDLVCCATERERHFMKETYCYPDDNIKTLGLCRFDNLLKEHKTKKQILIMPTHRMWLHAADREKLATPAECNQFMSTDFYQAYKQLLCNEKLIKSVRDAGYSLVFYPHYSLQSFIKCFDCLSSDVVVIADRDNFDVQELLMESKMLITDFSSVYFDFAYMGKPIIYYQFDEDQYRSEHFQKGYFDYRLDGYGPVYTDLEDVINETIRQISINCKMDDIYKCRVNDFFLIRDSNNCQRVFNEVHRKACHR